MVKYRITLDMSKRKLSFLMFVHQCAAEARLLRGSSLLLVLKAFSSLEGIYIPKTPYSTLHFTFIVIFISFYSQLLLDFLAQKEGIDAWINVL